MDFEECIKLITPPDTEAMLKCSKKWNSLAKPLHGMGELEEVIIKIAGASGTEDVDLSKKALVVMCSDNGVVEEGVSQSGQEVTRIVSDNFTSGATTSCIMSRKTGTDVFPVDIGVSEDTLIENKKIARGTKNMAKGPAMSYIEALKAIEVGINKAVELKEKGYKIIVTGEMGIGNTTTSAAMASVLLGKDVALIAGRGAGLSDEGLERKIMVIKKSIKINDPDPENPVDVLSKIGGFDIAGLCGVFLGGAANKIPVMIDGVISAVAALCACRICPDTIHYLIPSHVSKEPAGEMILDAMDLKPFLYCDMHLGEGTGALAMLPLLDLTMEIYNTMSTFDQINVEQYKEYEK